MSLRPNLTGRARITSHYPRLHQHGKSMVAKSSTAEYSDPVLGPVFQAQFNSQHTKVVKLAAGLSAEQRQGRVGEIIAKAYRKLITQRTKLGHLVAAAKQCLEMFELVPSNVQDVDKRRFNKILGPD